METVFTTKNAEHAALIYFLNCIQNKEEILDAAYLAIGIDNDHQPLTVYAKPLSIPDVFITGDEDTSEVFRENPNYKNEFLVCFEPLKKNLKVLLEPNNPLMLSIPWDIADLN